MKSSPKQELIGRLIGAFRDVNNQDEAIEGLAAARLGIGPVDMRCLNVIQNAGSQTPGELARAVGVTTGAVTGALDRLERAGYARREPDPDDRRRLRVVVTDEFMERAEEIWGPLAADWFEALGRFTVAELETVVAFLAATGEIGARHLERLTPAKEPRRSR
jgi:DNA-binding MarR family transcriptional regulator